MDSLYKDLVQAVAVIQLWLAKWYEPPTSAAQHYGELRAYLERQGTPIGPLDQQIAAHALALDITLVTNNVREFERAPGLRVQP